MTKKEQNTILKQAAQKCGEQEQLGKLTVDCAAMIVAINRYERDRENSLSDLLSMIAEIEIRLRQMQLIFNYNTINGLIEYKINRLQKTLHESETENPTR